MAVLKCKMCGGELQIVDGENICECEYCGSKQTVPTLDDDKKAKLYERAHKLRFNCDFEKAASVYENIINEFPEDAEGYWGLVLCNYGIEYVDDPATGKKVPTCHRSSFDSLLENPDFEMVMKNSEDEVRTLYRQEARQIEELRRQINEVSGKEEPYDIFICYKETDAHGKRTLDSVLAQDVYEELTDKGYRVFFSRISLEDKLGTEYEPYIFAALNSAKLMLAFGTSYENYNAVWVKNEWSRFVKLLAKDKSKRLIPCYKDIDPSFDLPVEFAKFQAQDMGKVGATQDLLRGIDKILRHAGDEKTSNKSTQGLDTDAISAAVAAAVSTGGGNNVSALLQRGFLALEDEEWEEADEFFEEVLNNDAECGQAYWGIVLATLEVKQLDAFVAKVVALIIDRKECNPVEMPMPNLAEIARKQDNGRGIVDIFTDEELNNLFSKLNPGPTLQSAENYFNSVASKLSADYIGEILQIRAFNRSLQYADEKINADVEIIISGIKASVEELAQKEKDFIKDAQICRGVKEEIAKRLSEAEEFATFSKEEFVQAKEEAEKKAEEDFSNAVALWNQKKAEYEHNYAAAEKRKNEIQGWIKNLESEMANVKGLFAADKKNEIKYKISLLKKTNVSFPENNVGEEPKREDFEAVITGEIGRIRTRIRHKLNPIKVGDIVSFGCYYGETVTWKVLDEKGDKKLLITEHGIDTNKYHYSNCFITWETSGLRSYMNNGMINWLFSQEEQRLIMKVINKNEFANDTEDKLFLLSPDEANRLFANDEARQAKPTEYAKQHHAYTHKGNSEWWLRSGEESIYAPVVKTNGEIDLVGEKVERTIFAIRPACWIDLGNL